jgi:hypothetical protein
MEIKSTSWCSWGFKKRSILVDFKIAGAGAHPAMPYFPAWWSKTSMAQLKSQDLQAQIIKHDGMFSISHVHTKTPVQKWTTPK